VTRIWLRPLASLDERALWVLGVCPSATHPTTEGIFRSVAAEQRHRPVLGKRLPTEARDFVVALLIVHVFSGKIVLLYQAVGSASAAWIIALPISEDGGQWPRRWPPCSV
jgi:hypothetical protein